MFLPETVKGDLPSSLLHCSVPPVPFSTALWPLSIPQGLSFWTETSLGTRSLPLRPLTGAGNPETASLGSRLFLVTTEGGDDCGGRVPRSPLWLLVPESASSRGPSVIPCSGVWRGGHQRLPAWVSDGLQPSAAPSLGEGPKLGKLSNWADGESPSERSETRRGRTRPARHSPGWQPPPVRLPGAFRPFLEGPFFL